MPTVIASLRSSLHQRLDQIEGSGSLGISLPSARRALVWSVESGEFWHATCFCPQIRATVRSREIAPDSDHDEQE